MLTNVSAADLRHITDKIADSFDSCASACQAVGIGGDLVHGHAAVARRMASDIRANGALGRLPSVFHDTAFHASADDEPAKLDAEVSRILGKLFI
jgi:hypothetical protein